MASKGIEALPTASKEAAMEAVRSGEAPRSGLDDYEVLFDHESAPTPAVTVIISLFNYEHHILECLESVRSQTTGPLDLLVADDRSRDDSAEVAGRWMARNADRFARCRLIRQGKNRGLSATRNLMFHQVRTEYVFVLDADNSIYPRCVEALSTALDHCNASLAYCYLERFGTVSSLISMFPWDPEALRIGNYIDAMVMLRRQTWEQVEGYSTDMLHGWEDYELWIKIVSQKGWGVLVPEVLARYRVHATSMIYTKTCQNESLIWDYLEAKHPELVKRPPIVPEEVRKQYDEVRMGCDLARVVRRRGRSNLLQVGGWAVAWSGIRRVEVLIDGRPAGLAKLGICRPDREPALVGFPDAFTSGFQLAADLSAFAPHGATLTVRAVSLSGKIAEVVEPIALGGTVDEVVDPRDARLARRVV